ncbi:hypothetical protein AEGHOMDF_4846 [Methylobacterium soli]|nr:hypothetical protein AEGHOMDF_4846 [Methylobacterium soli]
MPERVRHRDRIPDSRVAQQHVVDLGRIDIDPADDRHVLLAVHEGQISVCTHGGDVAGRQEAASVEDAGRLLRLTIIAAHDLRAPDLDLPKLVRSYWRAVLSADFDLGRADGKADSAALQASTERIHGGDAGHLG